MAEPFYAQHLVGFPVVVIQDVAWGDMDAMAHVNNVVYFRYFENARLEYLRKVAWLDNAHTTGVGPILSATQARFRRALQYPDTIAIGARLMSIASDRIVLEHCIISQGQNAVATEGQATIVGFRYADGVKAELPEELKERIRRLESDSGKGI